jgi:branched-chain amino acid transport system permease protein
VTERLKRLGASDWALVAGFALMALVGLLQGLGVREVPIGVGTLSVPFLALIGITIMLQAILALGLNVVVGWTGLLDLGYASFVSIGAFVVSLGLVLTVQQETSYPELPLTKIVLTQAQRTLTPAAGGEVVVRQRFDQRFDVVEGAPAVLAALAPGSTVKTIAARHEGGFSLPVGDRVAHGALPFHFPGGYFVLLLLAGCVAAVAGVVRGFPTLRLTGDYYAIVTLGFAEIVWLITANEDWLTGGAFGIKLAQQYRPVLFGVELYNDTWQYYAITFAALLLTIAACLRLQRSRVGRAWAAIKADETAARASGIDVDRAKMLAFAASGFIGGVGGGLFAIKLGTVPARFFDIWLSILVVASVVLGGMGSVRGALAGSALLMGLGELLRVASDASVMSKVRLAPLPPEARFLVYGAILVILMRFRPQGLLPPRAEGPPPTKEQLDALRAGTSPLFTMGGPT